jgi:hypothetical protein
MNKKNLLFTLILIASCLGILGVAEKTFAATDCITGKGGVCCDVSVNQFACSNIIVGATGCGGGERCCTGCGGGERCCQKESCQKDSTVPQLPTDNGGINVQEPTTTSGGSTVNLSDKKLSEILEDLIKWLLKIVILIAILMIIVSGAMYMISAGDQQKADTAKKALTYAILGLLVVALAYAIVNTLVDILT